MAALSISGAMSGDMEWGAPIDAPPFASVYQPAREAGFVPKRLSEDALRQYCDEGYCVVQGFPPAMLTPLRLAADRAITRSRRGEWPNSRMCRGQTGEPIPGRNPDDIWGVSNLLHPDLQEPAFAEYMASPHVLDVVADILLIPQSERTAALELQLVNMLCEPRDQDHDLAWHRDSFVGGDATQSGYCDPPLPEEKMQLEGRNFGRDFGTQWNAALYDDACLYVVPRSHRRLRTSREKEVCQLLYDEPERRGCVHMAGEKCVRLKQGEAVYFNSYLIHRGIYTTAAPRASIHACMGRAVRRDSLGDSDSDFMASKEFVQALPARLQPLAMNRYADHLTAGWEGGGGGAAKL